MKRIGFGRSARGLADVEFAVVLPLLLLLGLGIVDFGRGLVAYMELEEAAQEGALYGSFAPIDSALVEARVRSSSGGLVDLTDTSSVSVDVECPDADEKIRVRVGYTLVLLTPVIGHMFGESIQLETRSVGTNFTDGPCTPSP